MSLQLPPVTTASCLSTIPYSMHTCLGTPWYKGSSQKAQLPRASTRFWWLAKEQMDYSTAYRWTTREHLTSAQLSAAQFRRTLPSGLVLHLASRHRMAQHHLQVTTSASTPTSPIRSLLQELSGKLHNLFLAKLLFLTSPAP